MIEYAGIEVPQLRDNRSAVRKVAQDALRLNQVVLKDKRVRLEILASEDSFGEPRSARQAYAYSGGSMINATLLKKGLGVMRPDYTPGEKYYDYFRSSQEAAIRNRLGIWKVLTRK